MSEAKALEVVEEKSALVVQQQTDVLRPSVNAVVSFKEYQQLQKMLDQTMPNSIVKIQGNDYRTKPYWRAIATAFNLDLDLVREERVEIKEDWGYLVTYVAVAPNGRKVVGDGSCMASEKSGRMVTLHNVRAHAHTRAKNRAIADLVGFGEVSAEEMREDSRAEAPQRPRESPAAERPTRMTASPPSGPFCSEKQRRMLFAKSYEKAESLGLAREIGEQQLRVVLSDLGIESTRDVPENEVDRVLRAISAWTLLDLTGVDGPAPEPF